MTQFKKGADALLGLEVSNEGGGNLNKRSFSKFGIGTSYKVRVMGPIDLMSYYGYGVYGKVSTFGAKTPSTLNKKGFVESNLTSWDKAAEYHAKLAQQAKDNENEKEEKAQKELASKYRGSLRFILGFIDLATGKELLIDLSKPQAQTVRTQILKYEKKLGKLAFELTKTNATGNARDTVVSLNPLIDFEEDLTPEEQANFKAQDGKEFDASLFDGLVYEADEKEMLQNLVTAGFNLALIGESLDGSAADDELPAEENFEF
ncbi:hypothetical protein P4T38_10700 [Bacillus safensis]|uniref:hypothetical protein n=1 Tax=Bacillus safensis TaxID=561879 RepID=UPI002281B3B5|nr:hypothetical protein [Bacillus safensis]MCY7711258.1 hypothetical protein [Bacillus safensis]MCY7727263.1 hypothetical protein [Bacillus safensis]MED0883183.1 hypothetical protein [Bacillus safensis]MED0918469.1 hypothetical protein [Bacillus safensis]